MNGVHDMGGMHGMGPIQRERNEPVFQTRWESRVYVMNRALALWGKWTIDASRHMTEMIAPSDYFRMSYYERWYAGIIALLASYAFNFYDWDARGVSGCPPPSSCLVREFGHSAGVRDAIGPD